ncbi:MAG: DUF4190 domain-containing protein [Saprospiraceae bacterium]|nr:DUF4190 domain-containing protein [Saprospiraceae bacterium]
MKKYTQFLFSLVFLFLVGSSQAMPMATVSPIPATAIDMENATLADLTSMSRVDIEAQIGRKLSLSERMALTVLKRKAKQEAKKAGRAYDDSGTDGFAIAALVCGIVGFFTFGMLSVLAIVFGAISKSRIKKDPSLDGYGMAQAGFILGIVAIALSVLLIILFLALGLLFI